MIVPELTLDGWVARIRASEMLISLSPDTADELLLHLANDITDYIRLHKSEQIPKCPTIQPTQEKPAKIATNASDERAKAQNPPKTQTKPAKPAKQVKDSSDSDVSKVSKDSKDSEGRVLQTWTDDEIDLLRTCRSANDAQFVYASHYPDKRTDNSVWQKWVRLERKHLIVCTGQEVKIVDGDMAGDVGSIVSFTDDRKCANISVRGKPGAYQVPVAYLTGDVST